MPGQEKVLVYGATGAQGARIVRRLLDDGFAVRGLARGSTHLMPAGAEPVCASLDDADGLCAATQGVQKVVFTLPLAFDAGQAARWTENAVRAAERAGMRLFLFNASASSPGVETGVAAMDLKLRAERIVQAASLPSVVLRPTLYLGNLLSPWAAPGIVQDGVLAYPLPSDVAVAWTSWEDLAAAVSAALRQPGLAGRALGLGGPEALTGPALAGAVGRGLGRPLRYAPIPLDRFEAGLSQAIGPAVGREVAALYRWLASQGRDLLGHTGHKAAHALGLAPTSAEAWAQRQDWRAWGRPASPAP